MSNRSFRVILLSLSMSLLILVPVAGQTVTVRPRTAGSPEATSSPTPVPAIDNQQTLEELQTKIRQRLFSPSLRRGNVGVKIASLRTGKVVFESDSEKYFMPASNMKNFTVATGLEKLGPDFRFITSVFANAVPDQNGTITGDLRIFGRGDISISTAFFGTSGKDPDTYYKGIDRLVDRIAAAGIKRVEGGIVGDESYFTGFHIPEGWEWDDLQWYYGAEISALPINDNAVDVSISSGSPGSQCRVTISPPNTLFQIINNCISTGNSSRRTLSIHKQIDRNVLEIGGTMPAGDRYDNSITISHPADLFVAILKQRLESRGIVVTGPARTLPEGIKAPTSQIEVARLESPPFREIAAKTMKPSQNMFTETILWTLGEQTGRNASSDASSSRLGLNAVRQFLKQIGIADEGIIQYDGSGLSRHNLVTPAAVVALYTYMGKDSKYSQAWRDSLTIAGIDGTLRNRMKGTPAAANMRGKTGTLDQVSALSGYVRTAAGEELVVSIIVNGVAVTAVRTSVADDITVYLANFNGKID